MNITVMGAGYVGLVSGACFADFGHTVTCVDTDEKRIGELRDGHMPIYEPGLATMVASGTESERLFFTTDLATPVRNADVVFIAVGTPSRRGDGHADLTHVFEAALQIARLIDGYTVIATKSTVPVGTGAEIERIISRERPDAEFAVVSNPEFLREGAAINDFKHPDRIVIGTEDERARAVMSDIYRPLNLNRPPLLFMSQQGAELTKYAANAFLATKITFINEIADLCEKVGANVQDVALGIGLDNRIGSKFLHPGPGYGGSCFPKDTMALIKTAQDAGAPLRIVETVAAANARRKGSMASRVLEACGGSVTGKIIAILGLAFKPNTDDVREAPSLDLIKGLSLQGARIRAYDPEAVEQVSKLMSDIEYAEDCYSCAFGADALVIITEWDVFRALDMERIRDGLRSPVVVDLRNIYCKREMEALGIRYYGVGQP